MGRKTLTQQQLIRSHHTDYSQLSNGKASGPDRFLNEFFINGKETLTPYFHILFNKIFLSGYFPETWSAGEIIPLHKKGDKNNVDNYRGITLLSTLGYILSYIK